MLVNSELPRKALEGWAHVLDARSSREEVSASSWEGLLSALRRGEHERARALASRIDQEICARSGESRAHTRRRALRLALDLADAAVQGGVPAERADAAVLRAAGEIVACTEDDLGGAMRRLLDALLLAPTAPGQSAARAVRQAVEYIQRNFRRSLTLPEVARHVRLSPAYFSVIFKRERGIGFVRFLRELRLAEARRLLRETGDTVEAIANAVGYDDVHYFSRVFTREMGVPPGRYREQYQESAARE